MSRKRDAPSFEDDLLAFDKTVIQSYRSFAEADRVRREYWLARIFGN